MGPQVEQHVVTGDGAPHMAELDTDPSSPDYGYAPCGGAQRLAKQTRPASVQVMGLI